MENTTPEVKTEFRIPEANLWKLNKAFEKLNKRAAKLGVPAIKLTTVATEEVEIMEKAIDWAITGAMEPTGRFRIVHVMKFEGATPKLAGWTLRATIEQIFGEDDKYVGNLLRVVPGFEGLPTSYQKCEPWCDHCQTHRRRNETFIVQHDDGTYKQIGRNCLVDFLGGADPRAILEGSEFLFDASALMSEAEDPGYSGGYGYASEFVRLQTVLEVTSMMIRNDGWVSRKIAMEQQRAATSGLVQTFLFGRRKEVEEAFPSDKYKVTEEDTAKAEAAIEWAKTLEGDVNEYRQNLSVIARSGRSDRRGFGFACSMLAAHLRELGYFEERKRLVEANKLSQYIGEIGTRVPFTATVEKIIPTSSDFGALWIYKMRTVEGNLVTWFASSEPFAIGETRNLSGFVKKHEEYKGVKQTVVKLVKDEDEAAAAKATKAAEKEAAKAQRKLEREIKKLGIAWG
jgi:hypothetical protein